MLMTRKTETLYRAAILAIRELIPNINPTFTIGDFELALRKALETIFPSITTIGCWFHFTKAIYEKIQTIETETLHFLPEEEIRSVYLSLELPLIELHILKRN